jgi:3-oxoacyl-(acyl-carrier-protein) synthase
MNRVVVTGMGVLAPNGHGVADFEQALREGRSGIRSGRSWLRWDSAAISAASRPPSKCYATVTSIPPTSSAWTGTR